MEGLDFFAVSSEISSDEADDTSKNQGKSSNATTCLPGCSGPG